MRVPPSGKKLKRWVTRAGLIYPFESGLYRRWGVEADYVGHPLFDELERRPPREEVVRGLRERFGESLVGVLPGSRRQEVRAHMPMIVEACRRIRRAAPGAAFAVLSTAKMRPFVDESLGRSSVRLEVLEGVRPVELARASALCLTKSGTVTLEIASQGTPMVIFYRASPLVAFLAYGLARVPYIGLINVLAGRMICPEKAMVRANAAWVARQAVRLMEQPEAHRACRRAIERVLEGFAEPGASARAARSALALV